MISNFNLLAKLDDFPEANKHSETAHYFFPDQASEFAPQIDNLYMAIFWISTFFFVLIVALMCYFVVKYRRRPGVKPEPSASHNTTIEILWSVLPSIILVWIFYEGAVGFLDQRIIPDGAEEIQVEASSFAWTFTYPNGDTTDSLHLVQNRPVKLTLRSRDVLHSFFVPAFRQKMDVVPGRFTYFYAVPNRIGRYRVYCTEYCGDGHSIMKTYCQVHATDADRLQNTEWKKAEKPPSINGQRIYKIYCAGCHYIDGRRNTGPPLNEVWGTERTFTDSSRRIADENYIRDSIYDPNKEIVAGYEAKMPTFKGKLSEEDINHVIAFLKLKDGMATLTPETAKDRPGDGLESSEAPAVTAEQVDATPAEAPPATATTEEARTEANAENQTGDEATSDDGDKTNNDAGEETTGSDDGSQSSDDGLLQAR